MSRSALLLVSTVLLSASAPAQSVLMAHNSQNGGSHIAAFDPFDGSLQTASFIDLASDQAPINRAIQPVFTRGEWWVTDNVRETVLRWSRFGADYLGEDLGFNGDLEGAVQAFGSSWICGQEAPFADGTILQVSAGSVTEHPIGIDAPTGICAFGGELIVTGSNRVVRVDPATGNELGVVFSSFSQQGLNQPLPRPSTGRLLVARSAGFSDIIELDLAGNIVAEFDVGSVLGLFAPRACYELGNGNFLISWASGVAVVDPALTSVEHVLEGVTPWFFTETADVTIGQSYCGPAVVNSTGRPGRIAATGTVLAGVGELRVCAFDLPQQSSGYFIASQQQGLVVGPGGSQGDLCLSGTIGRFVQQVQSTSTVNFLEITVDTSSIPQPNGTLPILAGATWNFQAWHRDSVNGQSTSNFTDAVSVSFL